MPQLGAINFDDELFPLPEIFNPKHFLADDGTLLALRHFNPFGLGRRSCLGESLARMELFIIFITLIQNFRFSAVNGKCK